MSTEIPIEAQRIIDTHSFAVAQTGKAFVVRDPKNRKLGRFEGPELLPLLHQAVAAKANGKADPQPPTTAIMAPTKPADTKKKTKPALPGLRGVKASPKTGTQPGKGKTVDEAVKESPKHDPGGEPDEFEAEELDDTGGKTAKSRTPAVKKSALEWTTGKIGVLILKHADKSDTEIYAMCQEQGIKTKLLTVKGLRRYFKLCIACQIAIAEERPKPEFTDEEKADMAYQSKLAG